VDGLWELPRTAPSRVECSAGPAGYAPRTFLSMQRLAVFRSAGLAWAGARLAQSRGSLRGLLPPQWAQVILAPDHSSQVVAVDVWYHVLIARRGEGEPASPILRAHDSRLGNVKKAEHFQLSRACRWLVNGSTAEDRTNYFEALPPTDSTWGSGWRRIGCGPCGDRFHSSPTSARP
jgi:hypothetical protein